MAQKTAHNLQIKVLKLRHQTVLKLLQILAVFYQLSSLLITLILYYTTMTRGGAKYVADPSKDMRKTAYSSITLSLIQSTY